LHPLGGELLYHAREDELLLLAIAAWTLEGAQLLARYQHALIG
jgi:hypothetical protein